MNKLPLYLTVLISVFMFLSCHMHDESNDTEIISLAETLIATRPDSSLKILQQLDLTKIRNKALLAKAHYLTGYAKKSFYDYAGAITHLLYAEKFANEAADTKCLKLSCQSIMALYDSVGSKDGTAMYAMRTIRAYETDNDTAGMIEALSNAVMPIYWADMPDSIRYIVTRLESLAEHNPDSTLHSNLNIARTMENSLSHGFFKRITVSQNGIIDNIINNGDWQSIIHSDRLLILPSDILQISDSLVKLNKDTLAKQLIDNYCSRYAPDRNVNYPDIIRFDIFTDLDHPAYAIPIDRNIFFSLMLPKVERKSLDFRYNEEILKNQSISYQRKLLWVAGIATFLFLLAICFLIILLKQNRIRHNEELLRSAIELKNALYSTQGKWLETLSNLCNTYYEAYTSGPNKRKVADNVLKSIQEISISADFFPMLERKINYTHNNLMSGFRKKMPQLRDDEYQLFLLNALGLSIPTICLLLDKKRSVIYSRRVRLRSKIQDSDISDKDSYLSFLA